MKNSQSMGSVHFCCTYAKLWWK